MVGTTVIAMTTFSNAHPFGGLQIHVARKADIENRRTRKYRKNNFRRLKSTHLISDADLHGE